LTAGAWKLNIARWLADGIFEKMLPEVARLRDVPQAPEFHPEGDALIHTMQAIAEIDDDDDQRVFWAVMLHDIGKKETTVFVNGRYRSHGHAEAGANMVAGILSRFSLEKIADDVTWLVKHHHYHHAWNLQPGQPLSRRQQKFTEHPLFPLLLKVCAADAAGRKPLQHAL